MASKYYKVIRAKPNVVDGKTISKKTDFAKTVTGKGEIVTLTPHFSEAKTISSGVKALIEQNYAKRPQYGELTFQEVSPSAVDLAEIETDQSVQTGQAFEALQQEVKKLRETLKESGEINDTLRKDLAEKDQQLADRATDIKNLMGQVEGANAHIAELNKRFAEATDKQLAEKQAAEKLAAEKDQQLAADPKNKPGK